MNDILSGSYIASAIFVLPCHNKKSNRTSVEHLLKNVANGMTSSCAYFVCLNIITMFLVEMIFEILPLLALAMANENSKLRLRFFRCWW